MSIEGIHDMPLTITLSDTLVTQLRPKAKAKKLSLQELVEALLRHVVKADQ
jgi:predicted HicB family RNase H-like nuclease